MIGVLPHWSCVEVPSTAAPVEELVSATAAREYLRLETDADDELLKGLARAARVSLERESRHVGMRRVYDFALDAVPEANEIALPYMPLVSVASITSYDRDHVPTVLSTSAYYLDTASLPGRVILDDDATWPSSLRDAAALVIRFTAGYSTGRDDVPDPISVAIKQYVAALYEYRGEGAAEQPVPPIVRELLVGYWLPAAG